MKKIMAIVAIGATVLASCGKSEKQIALEKQQAIAAYQDSIKLDSFKRAAAEEQQRKVEEQHQAELAAARRSAAASARSYRSSNTVTTSSAGVTSTQAQKKGWSDAAKGTVIGAGVGALGGVLIDKNNARGAIIGGLAGAGAGYAIGRAEDRKSGRVQPKQ
ncbi:YMGG-like glycine zipper-containing protein [Pedobacter sp.]